MQIRYDLTSVKNFDTVRKQASFFLNKENCLFSFYLPKIAINFSIVKSGKFAVEINFSELSENNFENGFWKHVVPMSDYRLKELSFIKELFDDGSPTGYITKESVDEVVDFMITTVKYLNKANQLSLIS